ncbi:MAG: biotin/lipoyl-binding protein [Acidobacteria bacterium]|nr:biotin/lipoyl-binding protein [Acidobacteriota bacterium]
MKLEIEISGKKRALEFTREDGRIRATLDGRAIEADAVEIAVGTYSILLAGESYEVRVAPEGSGLRVHAAAQEFAARVHDPRVWRGRSGTGVEAEGRQQITAPMPGKIVRVLVELGAAVEAGQGLLVVEAMKMQNEVKSPKSGTVEKISVAEGQAVNAGDVLAVVV